MCNSVPGPVLNSNGQSKYDFKTLGLVNSTCFSRLTSSVISNPGTIYSRNRQYLQRDLSYFPRHLAYVPLYEGRHAGRKMNEVLEPMAQVPKRHAAKHRFSSLDPVFISPRRDMGTQRMA